MNSRLSFLVFATLVSCVGCGDSTPEGVHSTIGSDRRDIDLGKLAVGESPTFTFAIRNTSDSPFKITSIRKSCGCETADIAEGTAVPNGGVLSVPYSLSPFGSGSQTGHLTITTDSSSDAFKEIELTLKAQLPRKLWTTPDSLTFDTRSGELKTELRVQSELPGLLDTFREATTCRELVAVQLKERTKDSLILNVSIAPGVPDGDAFDYIVLRFDDPRNSLHTVSVRSYKESPGSPGWRTLVKTRHGAGSTTDVLPVARQ